MKRITSGMDRRSKIAFYFAFGVVIAMIATLAAALIVMDVYAGSKGLKVNLSIDSDRFVGSTQIRTYQFGNEVYDHTAVIERGYSDRTLSYPSGVVETGNFRICIEGSCGNGYNSPDKKPEYVDIHISGTEPNEVGSEGQDYSQAQSSSNTNENNNANTQSQSQTTQIYICDEGGCKLR